MNEPTYDPVLDDAPESDKRAYWEVAFGLQAVDDLKPSKYVQELAEDHIRGEKTYYEIKEATANYYENPHHNPNEHDLIIHQKPPSRGGFKPRPGSYFEFLFSIISWATFGGTSS